MPKAAEELADGHELSLGAQPVDREDLVGLLLGAPGGPALGLEEGAQVVGRAAHQLHGADPEPEHGQERQR